MTISVIGAGFGRTGTMSLKLALEQLGFGPCHHMEEVFANPDQLPVWRQAVDGSHPVWQDFLAGYSACVDWPSAHFWRELYDAFPGSKVILPSRSAESWWESYTATIQEFVTIALAGEPGQIKEQAEMCKVMIGEQCFQSHYADKDAAIAAFDRRACDVKAHVDPSRLLEFGPEMGWQPLSRFLNVPVPASPFPRSNSRKEFFENFDPTEPA